MKSEKPFRAASFSTTSPASRGRSPGGMALETHGITIRSGQYLTLIYLLIIFNYQVHLETSISHSQHLELKGDAGKHGSWPLGQSETGSCGQWKINYKKKTGLKKTCVWKCESIRTGQFTNERPQARAAWSWFQVWLVHASTVKFRN